MFVDIYNKPLQRWNTSHIYMYVYCKPTATQTSFVPSRKSIIVGNRRVVNISYIHIYILNEKRQAKLPTTSSHFNYDPAANYSFHVLPCAFFPPFSFYTDDDDLGHIRERVVEAETYRANMWGSCFCKIRS
jgi:hypothetical protein